MGRPGSTRPRAAGWGVVVALAAMAGTGCAKVPGTRYGVGKVHIDGATEMSPTSLRRCLATRGRSHAALTLGIRTPGACGQPPFDVEPPRLELWSWPWSPWPRFDRIALERDRRRVERWYEARGFHHARVTSMATDPEEALSEDSLPEPDGDENADLPCDRRRGGQGCVVEVTLVVDEGAPTLVEDVHVEGLEGIRPDLRPAIEAAQALAPGDRFDEALHEHTQAQIRAILGREGYARAEVDGVARIDRDTRQAWLAYAIRPGPVCRFGRVIVAGNDFLPAEPIAQAALIEPGSRYDFDDLVDAQRAITSLGAFSAVTVEPVLTDDSEVVDVRVEVTPAREDRVSLGVGIQAGELQTLTENISVPQWDVHLLARYENRNVFGGLRSLTLEERPRMIILERFPSFERPRFGNLIRADFRQPGLPEPRTDFLVGLSHEIGPDPYDVFFRNRLDTSLAFRREFFFGRLFLQMGGANQIYRVRPGEERQNGEPPPSNYELTFLEQIVRVDLRDDLKRPHEGIFVQLTAHESGYWLPSSWNYVRLLPDLRIYLPLPAGITWATRFALGMLFVTQADGDLDELSSELGPRDLRLRGGGASSNRGFLPGRLGDGLEGGTRRWEASTEIRVPFGDGFGLVGFFDMGDVSRAPRFRFDHPQPAAGFGLRFFTLVGAIRFDFAWRIPSLQVLADEDERIPDLDDEGEPIGLGRQFVFHLTIGEAF